MLRRMDEAEKVKALEILRGDTSFGRRELPHDETRIPGWPTSEQLQQLTEMNAMPATFTLQPGEYVHINKGRLHAFLKTAGPDRQRTDDVCVSVAWDWVFTGVTPVAVEHEMMAALKCAAHNKHAKVGSLGVTELCVMNMTKAAVGQYRAYRALEAQAEASHTASQTCSIGVKRTFDQLEDAPKPEVQQTEAAQPVKMETAADGTLKEVAEPENINESTNSAAQQSVETSMEAGCLAFTANKPNLQAIKAQSQGVLKGYAKCLEFLNKAQPSQSVAIKCSPDSIDTWVGLELQSIDPYLVEGFECKLCKTELSQRYAHCRGCEILLQKDWNICLSCMSTKQHLAAPAPGSISSRSHAPVRLSEHNQQRDRVKCEECRKCVCCQCTCHQEFKVRYRFELPNDRTRLHKWAQQCIEGLPLPKIDINAEFESKEMIRAPPVQPKAQPRITNYKEHSGANVSAPSRTKAFDKNEGRADLAAVWGFPQGTLAYVTSVCRPNKSRLPREIDEGMGGRVKYVLDGRLVVHFPSYENSDRSYLECKFTKAEVKACLRSD